MMKKAVGYVVRKRTHEYELLVFKHPITNHLQVIRGTIDGSETLEQTIVRELYEEAGIEMIQRIVKLGAKSLRVPGRRDRSGPLEDQEHHAFLILIASDLLPDFWDFIVIGDGIDQGDKYSYFWIKIAPNIDKELQSESEYFVPELIAEISRYT